MLIAESNAQHEALPVVTVMRVFNPTPRSASAARQYPGCDRNPVLSRSNGYVRKRFVDIGDRVAVGQLLAEIEAPELDNCSCRASRTATGTVRSGAVVASLEQGKPMKNWRVSALSDGPG